jgi:hypothetical protein
MFCNKCISAGCLSVGFVLTFFQGPASSEPEESFISPDGRFAFKYPNSFVKWLERALDTDEVWGSSPHRPKPPHIPSIFHAASARHLRAFDFPSTVHLT